MITQSELEAIRYSCLQLLESFDIESLEATRLGLESELADGSLWSTDPEVARKLQTQLSGLDKQLEQIKSLTEVSDNLQIAFELDDPDQVELLIKTLDKQKLILERARYLAGKFDNHPCILSVHAGAGGVDAQDWASMVTSMYQAFCQNQGFKCNIISISSGDEGGVKTAMLQIEGDYAYGLLKEEAGVHRLVRLSPFNSAHTRETSFCLVEVIPDKLDDEVDVEIDEKDLKWDTYLSGGKGGQSVNTTYSAVRVTHIPSGIVVTCQNERNQVQNRQMAMHYLRNKLAIIKLKEIADLKSELRGEFQSAEWGSQIRNYVLHPYKLVKDTRSGWETSNVEDVIENGEILEIIWSVKMKEV